MNNEVENNSLVTRVVIVGAGPTGLSMASQLIRYNIDCIIIEKNKTTTRLSKALVVQARTLEIFDELGIAKAAINEGQITSAMNMFYKGKQKAAVNIAGLGNGLSKFPFALSLEQSKTEELLADHLASKQKEVLWNHEFIRFEQDEKKVIVYLKNEWGEERKIKADYLVGCDGASSLVRHQMGLSFEGDTVPKLFYVADVMINSTVINRNELFMFLIRRGFILFFPMEGEGHYRIVGILPDRKGFNDDISFNDISDTIKEQVAVDLNFKKLIWFSSYKVHSRKANGFENGRCYVAGDAAHIHTPAGGQGMNTGIQDAYNLAWKLAYTLGNLVKTDILKTYSLEREENAKHLLRTTDRMFDMMAGRNSFLNFFRLHVFPRLAGFITKEPFIKKRIFPLLSQIGIKYTGNMLVKESRIGAAKSGVRMPYFVFSDGRDIFQYLAEPCFKLLYFGREELAGDQLAANLKFTLKVYSFKEIPVQIFGKETNFYVLLRPDNHIAYIGREVNEISRLLNI